MCGIAGYYYKSGKKIDNTATVLRMLEVQQHRGPDDAGIRTFSLVAKKSEEHGIRQPEPVNASFEGVLGFNRLSILDLSKNGHQPMCSPDEQVILTLNGEVYNAFDFKDELTTDGYRFRSTTDTEVVLYLYLKYGFEGMITRLNGMFAIVVADLRENRIFIARDRFGIKPMYLYETNELFAFSSEIKSFLPLPEFKAKLNAALLDEYLLFRNNINRTLFKDVECLEPGTFRIYSPGKGFSTHRYFDIEHYRRTVASADIAQSLDALKQGLKQSVNRQLLSDVTLGCQLSGGIDSSLVTYFAKDIKQDNLLETVSVIFEDPRFSEERYMDHVTNQLGLRSHKFQLDASYYLKSFEKATWHFEGPLNHPNTIGIYLLSERAKQYVTVLLSGEGADEVFGGYSRFARVSNPYQVTTLLRDIKSHRDAPLDFLKHHFSPGFRTIMSSAFMTPRMARSLKGDFKIGAALQGRRAIYDTLSGSTFDRQVKYEIKTYLPDLLIRQDKMSMAHSIENRVPFLDNDLVQQAFGVPQKHLLPNGHADNNKFTLKQMAASAFGDPFAFRQKQGFGIPLREFFNDKNFDSYLKDEIMPGIGKRGIFNGALAQKWISNTRVLSVAALEALWIVIAFEAWARKFEVG